MPQNLNFEIPRHQVKSRKLEYFESLLYYAHLKGVSQMTFVLSINGNLNDEMIKVTLEQIFKKHPMLRSTVHDTKEGLEFNFHDDFSMIPLKYLHKESQTHLEKIIQQESTQELLLNKCNWSATILSEQPSKNKKHYDLILHFSHVIADGLSMINIMQEIIINLEAQVNNTLPSISSQDLYPPMEKLLPKGVTINQFLDQQKSNTGDSIPLKVKKLKNETGNSNSYIACSINEKETLNFKNKAKIEDVTLNSALNAALILAYNKTIDHIMSLSVGSAINLRNKVIPTVPSDVCGNYFSVFTSYYSIEDVKMGLWPLARSYHRQLHDFISEKVFLPTCYQYKKMNRIVSEFMQPSENFISERIGSSYMGNIDFETESIRVNDIRIYPKNADQINMMIYIFNGELRLLFCYPKNYRNKAWMENLIKNFIEVIQLATTE
jgi:hypothetical protein